jgi:non-heme chloroperoxidase
VCAPQNFPEYIVMEQVRSVVVSHGIRLPYVEHGDPAGVPVIFLHGITDSLRSFENVLPRLSGFVRAFAISQRGHGDADRPETGYRPEDFARDVATFMDALELRSAVIVGHSMGGSVAQRFAIDYPERVAGLVLVGARAAWHRHPELVSFIDFVMSSLTDPVDPRIALEFQQSTIAQPVPPGWLDMAVAESLKLPARVWQAAFVQGVQQADLSDRLADIRVPTLLLCGELDTLAREDQPTLLAGIAQSRLELYPRTGHALHWEEPERFARDVAGFVRELRTDSSEFPLRKAG